MCNDRNLFTEFKPKSNSYIKLAVDKSAEIIGIGKVVIQVPNEQGTITLLKMYYVYLN